MFFIPFGVDCGPAMSLRILKLREFALPFDWNRCTPESLFRSVDENFKEFHEGLHLSECKKYVIDTYGNEFPHDYPTQKQSDISNILDCDNSIDENILVDHWMESIPEVKEKYARRIERFHALMNSDEPLIFLTKCRLKHAQEFTDLFLRKYTKPNTMYVVLSDEPITEEEKQDYLDKGVCLCEPETIWVDENDNCYINQEEQDALWKDAIVKLLRSKKIELPKCLLEDSPQCAPTVNTSSAQ